MRRFCSLPVKLVSHPRAAPFLNISGKGTERSRKRSKVMLQGNKEFPVGEFSSVRAQQRGVLMSLWPKPLPSHQRYDMWLV